MKKDEISFLISLSDARTLIREAEKTDSERLIELKNQLEQMHIKAEYLEMLGQLVVCASEEAWHKVMPEVEAIVGQGFKMEPNRLL
ncbi:hypothetical protein VUJ46_07170 [Chryseobacterium sp. MYb264]|uniref:hypothetical protein n=1 Tax=Chryseobacterium sp. MYb264 TaxID=2745153 RepID=UPI002E11A4C8|nr:hypothetical protein VUJ46_07170 [Chryseobacterium sp. MYb264]